MPRILILGADGAIGRRMADRLAAAGHEVIETTRRAATLRPGRIFADLAAPAFSADALPPAAAVVICAAMARFSDCRAQPELTRRINVTVPAAVARRYARDGAQVVLLSTSAVFDCRSPCAPAGRATDPLSAYGQQKAEAEQAVLAESGAHAVLRLSKVLFPDMDLIRGWIAALRDKQPIRAFSDMAIAPLSLDDVEAALVAVLGARAHGIYQASALDDLSYYAIAQHLAARLARPPDLVEAASARASGIADTDITHFTSLDTSRLEAICAWRPPDARSVVESVFLDGYGIIPTA